MPTPASRRPGRPVEERPRQAAIEATLDLIAEHGIRGLTTNAVAERAGISKATMYRRWRSKEDLLVDAVGALVSESPVPDTGSLRGDTRALLRDAVRFFTESRAAELIPALVSEMAHNPRVAEAVRSGFFGQRRAALRQAIDRARARGELRPDVDPELCLDLGGVVFYRFLITGGTLDERFADELTDALLTGIAATA